MRELNIETESFILGWLNIQRVGCRGQSRTADQEFEPRDNDPPFCVGSQLTMFAGGLHVIPDL